MSASRLRGCLHLQVDAACRPPLPIPKYCSGIALLSSGCSVPDKAQRVEIFPRYMSVVANGASRAPDDHPGILCHLSAGPIQGRDSSLHGPVEEPIHFAQGKLIQHQALAREGLLCLRYLGIVLS